MLRFLGLGLLFGFILSRVGATQYDAIAGMFLLTDLHLMGVIGVAAGLAGVALTVMKRRGVLTASGAPAVLRQKARKPGNIVGGLIFGAGWALTGTCPGTGLAQLGEGQVMALFTVAGMFLGVGLYRLVGARVELALSGEPESPLMGPPSTLALRGTP